MDLNEINESLAAINREVEFVPREQSTGWFFELRHDSAPEVREFNRVFQGKVRNLAFKNKTAQRDALVARHANGLRIAHVAGWRYEDGVSEGRPEFSNRELKDVLDGGSGEWLAFHLKNFIDDEVGTLEDFLERSESS